MRCREQDILRLCSGKQLNVKKQQEASVAEVKYMKGRYGFETYLRGKRDQPENDQ